MSLHLDERHVVLLVGTNCCSRHRPPDWHSAHRAHPLTSTPEHCAGRAPAYDRSAHGRIHACPAGRAARARARGRAHPHRAARRRPASRGSPGHRGRCGHGEVTAARGGTRTGVGARPPRPCSAGDGARAGVPVRGRAPALRAPTAGGRRRRARPLAGGSGGAGRGRAHRSADPPPGRRLQAHPPAIPATRGNTACTGSPRTSPPIRRSRSWSTTCSGATRRRRARSRSSRAGSRGSRSRSSSPPGRLIPR